MYSALIPYGVGVEVLDQRDMQEFEHVVHRGVELLAAEGALPRGEAVLLAADDALREQEAVHVVAGLLRHDAVRHGGRGRVLTLNLQERKKRIPATRWTTNRFVFIIKSSTCGVQ